MAANAKIFGVENYSSTKNTRKLIELFYELGRGI